MEQAGRLTLSKVVAGNSFGATLSKMFASSEVRGLPFSRRSRSHAIRPCRLLTCSPPARTNGRSEGRCCQGITPSDDRCCSLSNRALDPERSAPVNLIAGLRLRQHLMIPVLTEMARDTSGLDGSVQFEPARHRQSPTSPRQEP